MGEAKLKKLLRSLNSPDNTSAGLCVLALALLWEAVLCSVIIWKVPYTEIDWVAYMQEVEGFLQGERDYTNLKGATGPLVYPAGFVYIYSGLHWLTSGGQILPAQVVFAVLYLATQALVMGLYVHSRSFPPWGLALLCLSKRMHSLFVLRLFNDCIAMFIAYFATALLVRKRWRLAMVAYSAAVSVKMNVLLMAPPVLVAVLQGATVSELVKGTAAGVALQLMLGAPFLLSYPWQYLTRAFELLRVFFYVWSVNLKFLPEWLFLSKRLAFLLMVAHVALLLLFAHFRWCHSQGGLAKVWREFLRRSGSEQRGAFTLPSKHVLTLVFTGNFIGIVCARSLHYQFYSWYFHTIPFLLWQTRLPTVGRLILWAAIEYVWNVYPSNAYSSLLLLACHICILSALWFLPIDHQTKVAKKES